MRPKASFVIPSHNCATWLPHAVKSALDQTEKAIEVVIIDDGSTDTTGQYLDWLESRGDARVRVFRMENNVGRSDARNFGNARAIGDIIMVLDADDLAAPRRAELALSKHRASKASLVYGCASVIDAVGMKIGDIRADVFDLEKAISEMVNRICHSTVSYTSEFASRYLYAGGEVARLGIDDWAQQITAAMLKEKFDFIPETVAAYRILKSSITYRRDPGEVAAFKERFIQGLKIPA